MNAINTRKWIDLSLYFFAFLATCIVYLYKIKYFPLTGGDEASLLNIPYRAVTFGDLKYPIFAPQYAYDAGFWRAFPPINTQILRVFFHLFWDCTLELSRVLSAVLTAFCTLMALVLCKKNFPKLSSLKMIMASIVIGLTPAMILNARSTRAEQEVLFWGILATLGLLLLLFNIRSKRCVWFFGGICAGLASTTHPFGIVFPIIIFGSFLLNAKEWRELDFLTSMQRISIWIAGFLIPATTTLIDMFYKFKGFLDYYPAAVQFYKLRTQQFNTIFANNYSGLFSDILPIRLKTFFYQVNNYSLTAENIPIFQKLHVCYSLITWISVVLAIVLLISVLIKSKAKNNLPFALTFANYFVLGFLGMTLYFPPNQTYYIYLAFFMTVQLCLIYFCTDQQTGIKSLYNKILLIFSGCSFLALFLLNLLTSIHLIDNLTNIDEYNSVSPDLIFEIEGKFRAELGLFDGNEGTTIIDSYTWPFSGKDAGSWNATVGGFMPQKIAGAAFHTDVLDFIIDFLPTETKKPVLEGQRRRYANQVLNDLKLKRILVVLPNMANYYFYAKSTLGDDQIKLMVINNDVSISLFTSDALHLSREANRNKVDSVSWNITQNGYFLLIIDPEVMGVKRDEIKFYQNDALVLPINQSKKTKNAVNFYLFKLKPGEFRVTDMTSNQVIDFKHMIREKI